MAACRLRDHGRRTALAIAVLGAAGGLACAAVPAQAVVAGAGHQRAGIISTFAGGDGGPGPGSSVAVQPCGLKFARGALYIGGGGMVRRVNPRTGLLTTPVADRSSVCAATVDSAGNLLEAGGMQVRVTAARTGRFYGQKMTARHVYTIVDQVKVPRMLGQPTGDGGPATFARLSVAGDVELDRAGNVVVADAGSVPDRGGPLLGSLVRVVAERTGRFYGQKMTAGDIYTVAGRTTQARTPNGGLATRTWLGVTIGTVRPDRAGNLVVADVADATSPLAASVRVVAVRTGRFYGRKMTAGHMYKIAGNGQFGSSGDGGPAIRAALSCAGAAALDHAGNVVVADCGRVRVVAVRTGRFYGKKMTAGHIYSIAGTSTPGDSGDGRPAVHARVDATAVTVDSAGNVAIAAVLGSPADIYGPGLVVRLVAARSGRFYGRTMRAGDIYRIAGNGKQFSGDGGPPTRAELHPCAVAEDQVGNLVIGDCYYADTRVQLVAAASGTRFGRKMTKGNIYTIAAGVRALGVAVDRAGNVLVADGLRVRVVAVRTGRFYGTKMTAGHLYTIAGDGSTFYSGEGGPATKTAMNPDAVAVDRAGNVLAADFVNNRVWMVPAASGTFFGQPMKARHSYTIAGDGNYGFSGDGGPGRAAELYIFLGGVATDHAGNVLIADSRNDRVRVVAAASGTFYGQPMTEGDIYTIAGSAQNSSLGDGGPATKASVAPEALAVDSAGNVLIADADNRIRLVAAASETFYGQPATEGYIYTIAGNGRYGFYGDGGPATRAALGYFESASGVAVGRAGNVLIATDLRVRSVSG